MTGTGRQNPVKEDPVNEQYPAGRSPGVAAASEKATGDLVNFPESYDDLLRAGFNGVKPTFNPHELQPYSWYFENDVYDKWVSSEEASVARMMRAHSDDLMVVETVDEDHYLLVARDESGTWSKSPSHLGRLLASTDKRWAKDAIDSNAPNRVNIIRFEEKHANRRSRDNTLKSCGTVFLEWKKRGIIPEGLTWCHENDLDANFRYMGGPNGVLDLDSQTVLRGQEARSKYVTRRVPDEFDLDALHPDVDRIFAHLEDVDRNYLLEAFAYSIRYGIGKRIYILHGETNGGKSTVLTVVTAALGPKESGYSMWIKSRALLVPRYSNPQGHDASLMGIQDVRIAAVNEFPEKTKDPLDIDLLRQLDGVAAVSVRELGEKQRAARPATATPYLTMNDDELYRVETITDAIRSRIKFLKYPRLPGEVDLNFTKTCSENPEVRSAMLAKIVRQMERKPKARGAVQPPPDTPGITEAIEERYRASIGELGEWLEAHVRRGPESDFLPVATLRAAIKEKFPPDSRGLIGGKTEESAMRLARSVCKLQASKPVRRPGQTPVRAYVGFRLVSDEELESEIAAERNDVADFDADLCIQCPGKRATNGDPDNPLCDDHKGES